MKSAGIQTGKQADNYVQKQTSMKTTKYKNT